MNVALFTDSDVFAGTERHMLDLAVALRDAGVVPAIICPGGGALADRSRQRGVPVFAVEKNGLPDVRATGQLAGALRTGRFDVIHAHNGRCALLAALAQTWARRGEIVLTQHFLRTSRDDRRGVSGAVSSAIHRWVARRASRVIAISEAVRISIAERSDTAMTKVVTVRNGISDPMQQPLEGAGEIRRALGIDATAPLLVTAARLESEKGLECLVEAMPQIVRRLPSARCVILGEGRLRSTLERQIAALGLGGNVRLLGFRAEVLSIVGAANAFILPSAAEPFGLALVEAMALSRPVVATRAGGPLEIVEDGVSGLLVDPLDPAQLAAAVLGVLLAPEQARAFGVAARARFLRHFTARRMAAETADLYAEALGRSTRKEGLDCQTIADNRTAPALTRD